MLESKDDWPEGRCNMSKVSNLFDRTIVVLAALSTVLSLAEPAFALQLPFRVRS